MDQQIRALPCPYRSRKVRRGIRAAYHRPYLLPVADAGRVPVKMARSMASAMTFCRGLWHGTTAALDFFVGSFASWFAALHLRPAPALFEVVGRLFLGLVADLDVVHHALGAGRFRHARRGAFVLHYSGGALPIRDSALHPDLESVLADFRFRQLDANRALDRFVFLGGSPLRGASFRQRGLGRRGLVGLRL